MKKLILSLLIISLFTFTLTGCGSDDNRNGEELITEIESENDGDATDDYIVEEDASENLPSDNAQIVLDILEDNISSRAMVRNSLVNDAGFSEAEASMIIAEVGNFISWDYQAVRAVTQVVDALMEDETDFTVDQMEAAAFMLLQDLEFDLDEIDYGLAYFNNLFD